MSGRTAPRWRIAVGLALLPLVAPSTPLRSQTLEAPWANRQLPDPAKEQQARELMDRIRCVQCQGQAVGDSDAPIAAAMRSDIRLRIAAGESPQAIRRWLISRYGDYISYQPRFTALTAPLWLAPLALLLAALWVARRRFRRGGQ